MKRQEAKMTNSKWNVIGGTAFPEKGVLTQRLRENRLLKGEKGRRRVTRASGKLKHASSAVIQNGSYLEKSSLRGEGSSVYLV